MAEDHDRIEELLAGYVLRGLSGEDAVEAAWAIVDPVLRRLYIVSRNKASA